MNQKTTIQNREIQPEDSSLLQTKLLEKPLVTDKLTCNLAKKNPSRKVLSCCSTQWIEVKCEDHLGCCQLVCFCDSSTCPSVLTYSSGGMLFSGCPTCNVKKKRPFIISQRHHRPSECISLCYLCSVSY